MGKYRGNLKRVANPRLSPSKIQKRSQMDSGFHHFGKEKRGRSTMRNFRELTPEIGNDAVSPAILGKNLPNAQNPKKQTQNLEFRLGENHSSLPDNVLAFVASTTAESDGDSVIEEVPTVTLDDDEDESIPGSSTVNLPSISEDSEFNDAGSDIVVIKVKSKKSTKTAGRRLSVEVIEEQELLSVETNPGLDSIETERNFGIFASNANRNQPIHWSLVRQNMDTRQDAVHRRWKSNFCNYPNCLLPRGSYLDSLSHYISMFKKKHFRGLYVVNNPAGVVSKNIFRFVSYNVLCQNSMENNPHLYPYVPYSEGKFLGLGSWDKRWKVLQNEIRHLRSDVYCLQEVEADAYNDCFLPMFILMGFRGFYTQRDGRADGCAVFWRSSKFTAISQSGIDLNYGVDGLDKPNVAQIVILRHKFSGKELIIVNTHILFSPKRGDIKLYQLTVIFAKLKSIRKENQHIIFAGDLNIEPHSPLYNFIRFNSIEIGPEFPPVFCGTLSGQENGQGSGRFLETFLIPPMANVNFDCSMNKDVRTAETTYKITHPFRFVNVYDHVTNSGQKEVSTYHKDIGNPDHIFYTVDNVINHDDDTFDVYENGLSLIRRLTLPDLKDFRNFSGPLPNRFAGSDHIPLLADFALL